MRKKINIGLDIGIASVGWSIIDEDQNIIKLGVRLFNDVADPQDGSLLNEKRRSARSLRRRLTRIKTRKEAFKKFIIANSAVIQNNWVVNKDNYESLINIDITKFGVQNPIELKVKALHEKISKEALVYILFHYIHHRGFFYLKEDELTDEIIAENKSKQFPSEKIYEFYKANGYYKGYKDSNNFSAEKYKSEIKEIFNVQGITDQDFIKKYIDIFSAVRDFATGPGSEKSPTPYGMWRRDENGEVKKLEGENLWDALIGKCTYYPEEKRGGKNSPIAEVFNLINDINNIRFFGSSDPKYKLNKEIKEKIYESYSDGFIKKTFNITPKNLIKIGEKLGWFKDRFGSDKITEKDVYGYRVNKEDKAIITELKNFSAIIKYLLENNLIEEKNVCIFNPNLLKTANDLFVELAKYQDAQKRINVLKEMYSNSSDESNLKLIKSLKGLTATHSLSYKAMNEFISFALNNLDSNDNQMQYFENTINKDENRDKTKYGNYLPINIYKDEVISPTAKRAFNQSVNVLNAIMKKYGKDYEIDNITIELARDKNTAEERKYINEQQKKNEKLMSEICNAHGIDASKLNAAKKLRLRLWTEQGYKDIYDGNHIELNEVLSGTSLDIDHIIPFSISNDDSYNNKVLTKTGNNKHKGNLTPYLWLSRDGKYKEFRARVEDIIKNKYKVENLLFEQPDPEEELSSFVARNLVDTRYSSRILLNLTQDFFNNNEDKYGHTKVKVIRGKMTNFARNNLFVGQDNRTLLPKDRDVYCHHAIDAAIICWLGMNHGVQKLLDYSERVKRGIAKSCEIDDSNRIIDPETGEVKGEFKINKSIEAENFGKQLAKYNTIYDSELGRLVQDENGDKIQFSRMMLSKNNAPLSNETVYSFKWARDNEGNKLDHGNIIGKIDLLTESNEYLDKLFRNDKIDEKELNNLLCYKSKDKSLYNNLKTIYNNYYKDDKENIFISYMKSFYSNEGNPVDEKVKSKDITDVIRWIDINGQRVRFLKFIGKEKTVSNTIVLKNHNDNAIMESLNPLSIRIYKNNKDKYVLVPINQKVLTYDKATRALKIDKEKLNLLLNEMNISNNKYIEVKNGTIFVKKNSFANNLYYSNGGGQFKQNKLELKSLIAKNEYAFEEKRNQMQIPISTIMSNYFIANVDDLGNIYNKKEIKID